tara:strand:+ start:470 stop:595 length:126 start_codon:yes stop_codon:yes gene_type:complete
MDEFLKAKTMTKAFDKLNKDFPNVVKVDKSYFAKKTIINKV